MIIADQIDSYIQSQLAKIRTGRSIALFNGSTYTFQTDAGQIVDKHLEYTERDENDMPSLVFYTGKNTTDLTGEPLPESGMENHLLECSIEGFIESDKAGTEGNQLCRDVAAALRSDPWWGGLLIDLRDWNAEIAIQVGDTVFTIAKVAFTAVYTCPFGSE